MFVKTLFAFIAGAFCFAAYQATGQVEKKPVETSAGKSNVETGAAEAGKAGLRPARIVVRGWEVQAAFAIKRNSLTRVLPDYRQRKLVGNVRSTVQPRNGEFLVVLVQTRWATTQIPNAPLFSGKPSVTLVDESGVEYPAIDSLSLQAGEFVTRGMGAGAQRPNRNERVGRTGQALIYFDVPNAAGQYSLRVAKEAPLLPVTRVINLPQLETGGL